MDIAITLTPKDLKRIGRISGWAPGGYMGKCGECDGELTGDKRAIRCFVCAIDDLKRQVESATLTERQRCIDIVDKAAWSASSEAIVARIKA